MQPGRSLPAGVHGPGDRGAPGGSGPRVAQLDKIWALHRAAPWGCGQLEVDKSRPKKDVIGLTAAKTSRKLIIPICPALKGHISSLPGCDDPKAPIHSRAHRIVFAERSVIGICKQFAHLLKASGVRQEAESVRGKAVERSMSCPSTAFDIRLSACLKTPEPARQRSWNWPAIGPNR